MSPIELTPTNQATHSIIWLHGLGADGHDFEAIVPELNLPADAHLRFIFPHAPVRPITMSGGFPLRAWFDLFSLERFDDIDEEGIKESIADVTALIKKENERGIPSENIILAGFSQGGAIALLTALTYPEKLAGVMGLSTYLPLTDNLTHELNAANEHLPIFLVHGHHDQTLEFAMGTETRNNLMTRHYPVEWHEYPMGHEVCRDELTDIRDFLLRVSNFS